MPVKSSGNVIFTTSGSGAVANLKIFCTIAVRGAVSELLPSLEHELGQQLDVTWGTAPMLVKRVEEGESADVLVLSQAGIDALRKAGKLVSGSEVTLASSATAIAVKAGAPKPAISTPDAFVQTLLNAKGVAYTHPSAGGASGVYFAQLIERLGIADRIKAKSKHPPAGGFSAELLLTGDADIAIQQKPELMHVAGTEVVGLFPGDLNVVTVFVAAVMAGSAHTTPAKAFIGALRRPDAVAVFRAKGLETP
jgi:molybdate transport system substrate-binding protein